MDRCAVTDVPIEDVLGGLILEALAEDLDLAVSYAISSREAALRGDAKLIAVHVAQLRLCVIEAISKCKELTSRGPTGSP